MQHPSFAVIGGRTVREILRDRHKDVVEVVRQAYLAHGAGRTVNPPSYFLRFPDRPASRIIALPASLGGDDGVDGIKWISSVPDNITSGLPRASAVLILNDPVTGYPYCCLESSIISATRTAASAALAADVLHEGRPRPRRLSIIGTGLISRYIDDYLGATGWTFDHITVHDREPAYADRFAARLRDAGRGCPVEVTASAEHAVRDAGLIVFATTAAEPHVTDPSWFAHHPTVLNVSLRDLSPEVILASANVLDDVDHCLKAGTSPHLAAQRTGNHDFVSGVLADVLRGDLRPDTGRPLVFSPFGLGVLDLALGRFIHREATGQGLVSAVPDFFADLDR